MAVSRCVWCIGRPSSSFSNRKLSTHLNSREAEVTGGQVRVCLACRRRGKRAGDGAVTKLRLWGRVPCNAGGPNST
ncbi:hypothetical protein L2E82_08285 [Cichorium intybus]|uniref:Uncharacterized protein n=1 Tax=Cichorium intybus TaxID=13427 RepID=A0ACB9G6R7_CICIN|nr:hypothetical protein L2E82_08285 [Cichorium intybus]